MANINWLIEEVTKKKLDEIKISCKYGNNRTVLNHRDSELLAYGYGLGGFVAIYKNKFGYPRGIIGTLSELWSRNPWGMVVSLRDEEVNEIIGILATETRFVNKNVDELVLKEAVEKQNKDIMLVGEMHVNEKWGNDSDSNATRKVYRIYRRKSGNLVVYSWHVDDYDNVKNYEHWKHVSSIACILDIIKNDGHKRKKADYNYKITKNTIPDNTIKEMIAGDVVEGL